MAGEIAFMWTLAQNDPRGAMLHHKLYGQKVVKVLADGTKKEYVYGGILTKWINGKRVVNCHHARLGESTFSIPDMEKKKFEGEILNLFKTLKIPVRRLRLVENDLFVWD